MHFFRRHLFTRLFFGYKVLDFPKNRFSIGSKPGRTVRSDGLVANIPNIDFLSSTSSCLSMTNLNIFDTSLLSFSRRMDTRL